MKIGVRILNLLDAHNMSQRELAARLQIAPTTLNGYIRGKHEPDCTTLVKIAQVLGVSVDELLGHTVSSDTPEQQLLQGFRSLCPEQQAIVIDLISLMQKRNMKK